MLCADGPLVPVPIFLREEPKARLELCPFPDRSGEMAPPCRCRIGLSQTHQPSFVCNSRLGLQLTTVHPEYPVDWKNSPSTRKTAAATALPSLSLEELPPTEYFPRLRWCFPVAFGNGNALCGQTGKDRRR